MINVFNKTKYSGLPDDILMYKENYIARPIMVNKSTITGLTANADGKFIIPKGTYLTGTVGSLRDNPSQFAKQATFTGVAGTVNILTYIHIEDKKEIDRVLTFKITKPAKATTKTTVTVSNLTVEVFAKNDGTNITATLGEIVTAINGSMEANSLCVASLTDETHADDVAVAVASAVTTGGTADTGTGDVDGILVHDVDVTLNEASGALMIAGVVDLDKIPTEPSASIKAKLPTIIFMRKD